MVGNKDDMYQFQEITNDEGLAFAKELNSLYKRTSAKSGKGIDDLFKEIGKKLLHPDLEITSNMTKEELKNRGIQVQRKKIKNGTKKGKCC